MRTSLTVSGCAAALLLLIPALAIAESGDTPAKTTYLRYCGACHGEDGKGQGVVSGFMQPKPPDLTTIAKNNEGEFPFGRMIHVIDGRLTVRAHGDPEMPVWGEMFKAQDGMSIGEEAEVRGKLLLIVEYLSSIQQK
jgi:mono/diheme cytochrome c family protein